MLLHTYYAHFNAGIIRAPLCVCDFVIEYEVTNVHDVLSMQCCGVSSGPGGYCREAP